MRIANNIMAMNTHRQYTINNNAIGKSAEKLSSGYRVNRAGDDAAGLAISEKMRSQIRGLNMASKNSQDGNSLIQTAEGALQEVHSVLQRMNELSVQSATGTNQTLDRNALNAEFQQLRAEINDIAEQTTFNDMNLLDGTFTTNMAYIATTPAATNGTVSPLAATNPAEAGAYTVGTVTGTGKDQTIELELDGNVVSTLKVADVVAGIADWTKSLGDGDSYVIDLTTYGLGSYQVDLTGAHTATDVTNAVKSLLAGTSARTAGTEDQSLKIQVGAKEGEQMMVGIDEINSTTLGLDAQTIATQDAAGRAISVTRSAINQVSTVRGALGAAQNRLDHKIANLGTSVENLAAAESRIRDVDMASEMTSFTKSNILSQAATAMLAQANSLPQNVLSLLK